MKITYSKHRHMRGLTIAMALILFLLFIVFIGTLVYTIFKAIGKLPQRPPPPEEAAMIQQAIQETMASLQSEHPGKTITIQSISAYYIPVFEPFGPVVGLNEDTNLNPRDYVRVLRSTNLVDWEMVASLGAGETYSDTNIMERAFYRSVYSSTGWPVTLDTNHTPSFRQILAP